jgi:RNA polymerase sigma factor (sigma-70 family)
VAQDEWKRRRRERVNTSLSDEDAGWENRLAHTGANAEERLQKREMLRQVNEALEELSEAEREVLVLFHQEECTYEQIAQVMRMPVNTVRTHLHRGRRRLKAKLKERSKVCSAMK